MKIIVAVLVLLIIPVIVIIAILERNPCERIELGYNCKGKNCECNKKKLA